MISVCTVVETACSTTAAFMIASRLAIVDRGRVVAEGEPARLKADLGATTLDEVYLHHAGRNYSDATRQMEGASR